MNDIKQLEERIAQLTELVKTGSEAIESMKTALNAAEEERDRLADQRREQEPKFERVKIHEVYHSVTSNLCNKGRMKAEIHCDNNDYKDEAYYRNNNYFHTDKRAQEVADKINFLLKLERLHDIYCPDYVPDWGNDTETYIIPYGMIKKRYFVSCVHACWTITYVYFPTREIAQKVCDILNAELEEKI